MTRRREAWPPGLCYTLQHGRAILLHARTWHISFDPGAGVESQ